MVPLVHIAWYQTPTCPGRHQRNSIVAHQELYKSIDKITQDKEKKERNAERFSSPPMMAGKLLKSVTSWSNCHQSSFYPKLSIKSSHFFICIQRYFYTWVDCECIAKEDSSHMGDMWMYCDMDVGKAKRAIVCKCGSHTDTLWTFYVQSTRMMISFQFILFLSFFSSIAAISFRLYGSMCVYVCVWMWMWVEEYYKLYRMSYI